MRLLDRRRHLNGLVEIPKVEASFGTNNVPFARYVRTTTPYGLTLRGAL